MKILPITCNNVGEKCAYLCLSQYKISLIDASPKNMQFPSCPNLDYLLSGLLSFTKSTTIKHFS